MYTDLVRKMERLKTLFERENHIELRKFSNEMIEQAAVENDRILAEISVIAYSLLKIESKEHIVKSGKWPKVKQAISDAIAKGISSLEKSKFWIFKVDLERIAKNVASVDNYLGMYVQKTSDKARIKQASRAYAAGMSMRQASALAGAEPSQVMEYIGRTKIHEEARSDLGIKDRINKFRQSTRGQGAGK